MAAAKKPARRGRETKRRPGLDFFDLIPAYLRPSSRAWKHFEAAKIEFCEGLRAALEEAIEEMRSTARRRETARLTRIRVQE